MIKKICTVCKKNLSIDKFYKSKLGKHGHDSKCKVCKNTYTKAYRQTSDGREKVNAYNKQRYHMKGKFNPKLKDAYYRKLYNISLSEYKQLLVKQQGVCAICGTDTPGGRGDFHVDHDHITGTVRGLLCHSCNTGIGLLNDSIDLLIKATNYLKKGN